MGATWATGQRFGLERFLPVSSAFILHGQADESRRLFIAAPRGTPVYAIESGTVRQIDRSTAGEVELAIADDRSLRYHRLLPSSIAVDLDQTVMAGQVLGVVGAAVAETNQHPGVLISLRDGTGRHVDVARELVGLADPIELGGAGGHTAAESGRGDPLKSGHAAEASGPTPASTTADDAPVDDLDAMIASRVRRRR